MRMMLRAFFFQEVKRRYRGFSLLSPLPPLLSSSFRAARESSLAFHLSLLLLSSRESDAAREKSLEGEKGISKRRKSSPSFLSPPPPLRACVGLDTRGGGGSPGMHAAARDSNQTFLHRWMSRRENKTGKERLYMYIFSVLPLNHCCRLPSW